VVIQTVVWVAMIVVTTANVAMWAFRPNHYSAGRLARRWTGTCTVAWAIALPAAGAAELALGGRSGVVTGTVALACWPVILLALVKRRGSPAAQEDADRLRDEQLAALLDERGRSEVDDLVAAGKRIYAIRRVRELTGLRLIDAKRLVGSLQR
jgi:hypothetical protein